MTAHELKCWPQYFEAIVKGRKRFELRYDDRSFAVDDILYLREYNPETKAYSGFSTRVKVVHILRGEDVRLSGDVQPLQAGWVIMSIGPQY